MAICKNCGYFEQGFCKRYPRTVVFTGGDSPVKCIYPAMQEDDWCGEFRESMIPSKFDVLAEIQQTLKDHGDQP
jgi:hypothetical protein